MSCSTIHLRIVTIIVIRVRLWQMWWPRPVRLWRANCPCSNTLLYKHCDCST